MADPISSKPSTATTAASATTVSAPQSASASSTQSTDTFHDVSNDVFNDWKKHNQDAVKSGGEKVSWDDYQRANLPGRLEAAGYSQIDASNPTSRESYATVGADGSTTLASGRPGPRVISSSSKTTKTGSASIQKKAQPETGKQQAETRPLPEKKVQAPKDLAASSGVPATLDGIKVKLQSAVKYKAYEGYLAKLGDVKVKIMSASKPTIAKEPEQDPSNLSDISRVGLSTAKDLAGAQPDIEGMVSSAEKEINQNPITRNIGDAASLAWTVSAKGGPVLGTARMAGEEAAYRITGKRPVDLTPTPHHTAAGIGNVVIGTPIAAASVVASTPALLEGLAVTARTEGPIAAAGAVGLGIGKIGLDYLNYGVSHPQQFVADTIVGAGAGGMASKAVRTGAGGVRSSILTHRIVGGVPVENAAAARAVTTIGKGIRGIESPVKKDPDLSKVLNIGENAPAVESVLADTPHSIYGTVTTYGQMEKPPRITKDVDLFVEDVGAFNKRVISTLGPDYQIEGQGITRTIAGKTAHAIDTHQIPPGYPIQTKTPLKFEYAGDAGSVDLPFDFTPDRLITANRLTQEPLWSQASRKAAAVIGEADDAGGWKFGPASHRAKDIPDLITTTDYLIQSERARLGTPLRNPIRWYRLSRMEKALDTVRQDPTLTRMVKDAGLEMPGTAKTSPPPLLKDTAGRASPSRRTPAILSSKTSAAVETPAIFRVHKYPTSKRSPGGGRSSPAPFSPAGSPGGKGKTRPSVPSIFKSPSPGSRASPTRRQTPAPSPSPRSPPPLIRRYGGPAPQSPSGAIPSPSGGRPSPSSRRTPPTIPGGASSPSSSSPPGSIPNLNAEEKRRYMRGWKTKHTRREVTAPILSVWEVTGKKPPRWFTQEVKKIGRSHFTAATTTTETGTTRTRRKPPLLASLEQPKKKRRKR